MTAPSANTMDLNEPKPLDLSDPDLQDAVNILIAHEHALCRGDEDAADELLADLEPHLCRLNWAQNEWLRGLSGDLHMLNDEEVLEPNEQSGEEYRKALRNVWGLGESAPNDANNLLALLRKEQDVLTRDMVSFGRASAYRSLGFPQLAREFSRNAVRLDPNNLDYHALLSEGLPPAPEARSVLVSR
jgi:tetratricopeptide (TPR) repeat protein